MVAVDAYGAAVTLANETVVDFPALTQVMNGVEIGTEVASSVWRAMRQALSEAITLKNKSHPAHGSNFDKKQRPEVQIIDWAKPISGDLKVVLTKYFQDKWGIYLK